MVLNLIFIYVYKFYFIIFKKKKEIEKKDDEEFILIRGRFSVLSFRILYRIRLENNLFCFFVLYFNIFVFLSLSFYLFILKNVFFIFIV